MARKSVLLSFLALSAGCPSVPAMGDPKPNAPVPSSSTATVSASPSAAPPSETVTPAAPADAGAATALDAGAVDASARAEAKDNMVRPALDSEELQQHAHALFDAIVRDEPPVGDPFWFPKEPFVPLKDVKGPDKYWDNLHRAYANDIRALHKKRRSWDGAKFVHFTVGSTPKWVKPGDEANKIGYFRSFRGKLSYEIGGETSTIDVHTIISWQGSFFVTHLRKFKK